ncbi:MAG TPA: hypothetical protein VK845_11985 [Gemmatimonadales bacterium]|nr:hypothetical protein [Gemmatimonadales bacterium]
MARDRTLLRWGAVSTFAAVIVFVVMLVVTQVEGGLDWAAWVPTFSIFTCLYVVFLLAGYEYLAPSHGAHAKLGLGFGLLLIVVLFAEIAAWSADRMLSAITTGDAALSPMLALFNSTHVLAIWFHGLWLAFWGAAFVQMSGRARLVGGLMLAFAASYSVYYLLLRLGYPSEAEWAHTTGHVFMVISHWLLGLMMLKASRHPVEAG